MKSQCCDTYSKFTPVTHVIFDLDGTLIDSEGVYAEALQVAVEAYGKPYSPSLKSKISGTTERTGARMVIDALEIDTTIEEFLKIYNEHATKKLGDLDLRPGAEKLVRHLHKNNIPMAVATSSQKEGYELKTKKFDELFSLFSHIVCGGTDPDVKASKPAPDIFLICASRFADSPKPSKCLVFEDSANGVRAALAAEMQVVMTPDESVPYDIWKIATLRIDTFDYMMPQLFGLPPFPPGEAPVFPDDLR